MGKRHTHVVIIVDALDEAQLAKLIQDLRELGLAPSNGHGREHPAPGPSGTQQGREQ